MTDLTRAEQVPTVARSPKHPRNSGEQRVNHRWLHLAAFAMDPGIEVWR